MSKLKLVSYVLFFLFLKAAAFGQTGNVAGKVQNAKNEALPGVSVKIEGSARGTTSDLDGRYVLSLPAGKQYTLIFSAVGYDSKTIEEVVVPANEMIDMPVILQVTSKDLDEVTVTASRSTMRRETVNSLIQFQKNTTSVAQVVSAESIKKSPDRNTGEVLKRVPGVSLMEGKYIIVRGLPDRYNQATINGAMMASTEPDRKTFSFDIFPASIVDNIIINKTATPEMPAEFAGGLVQLNTKDVPDINFFEIAISSGANLQAVGHDFYSYAGGKRDWMGIDDGTRKMPAGFPNTMAIKGGTAAANAELGKQLSDAWSSKKAERPVNYGMNLNGGFVSPITDRKSFGGVFSLNYNKRNNYSGIIRNNYDQEGITQFDNRDKQYDANVLVGGLANLTYRSGTSRISWKNSFNINSSDQLTSRVAEEYSGNVTTHLRSEELYFVSNRLFNSQLIGEHVIKPGGIRVKWNANYALLKQDIPDLRRLKYTRDNNGDYYANISSTGGGNPNNAGRFFSVLDEHVTGGSLDLSKSILLWGNQQQIKIGGLYQHKDRSFAARGISIAQSVGPAFELLYLPPDQIFAKENYAADKFYLDDKTVNADSYDGISDLAAAYLQFDNQFSDKLRLVWGVRMETYNQELRSFNLKGAGNGSTDLLPSFNFTYKLNPKANLRLAASQTVSRPEFREISPFSFYDYARNGALAGNPDLERTKVSNLDLRYEWYPRPGELITLGVFYKYFKNPIETKYDIGQGSPQFGYWNAASAVSYGVEADIRKYLGFINEGLKNFTLFANVSVIKSSIKVPEGYLGESDRPMQGQSPYVVNAGLQYDRKKSTSATLLFNVIGRRIFQVGNENVPQIWENPRPLLDFQVSQKLGKNTGLKFSITDILGKDAIFYQDIKADKKYTPGKGNDRPIYQITNGSTLSVQFVYAL